MKYLSLFLLIGLSNISFAQENNYFPENISETPSIPEDTSASPTRMFPPRYPPELAAAGITGVVVLVVTTDANGGIEHIEIEKSSNNEIFDNLAVEAAKLWRFRPAVTNGIRVSSKVRVPIDFGL